MSKYLFLSFLLLALLVSCDDDNPIDSGNDTVVYQFADYVHINTDECIILKSSGFTQYVQSEISLCYEKSFGEPFTDVNGNGVYDEGIDIFIMSPDTAENMDIDRNSRYTGPDDSWSPGIPFDDINGDGIFQDAEYSNEYFEGMPYFDYNQNNEYDSTLDYYYNIIRFSETGHYLYTSDSVFYYVSDSGGIYYMNDYYWEPSSPAFDIADSGLIFEYEDMYGPTIYVLDTGQIAPMVEDSCQPRKFTGVSSPPPVTLLYRKTVYTGDSLTIDDTTYNDLLHIIFDEPRYIPDSLSDYFDESFFELYFSKELGPLYVSYKSNKEAMTKTCWFNRRCDSLPILLTK